ncbi:MAG: ANTAR domain-containing protein [Pseudomonadales bacterium]|nr:ANTAR domain-containing protein [Pseudomonadales bacterium]
MAIKAMLVNSDNIDSVPLEAALQDNGFLLVYTSACSDNATLNIEACNPDIVVINTNTPSKHTLDIVSTINRNTPRPIVMFSEQGDSETIADATKAGVSAYVLNDIRSYRIKSIVDAAIARFNELQRLKDELSETRSKLDDRKSIERAKGLLMSKRNVSENEAYRQLQKMAMAQNKKIGEIAKNILAMADLIG